LQNIKRDTGKPQYLRVLGLFCLARSNTFALPKMHLISRWTLDILTK